MNTVEVYNPPNWITIWETATSPMMNGPYQSFNLMPYRSSQLRFRMGHSVGAGAHVVLELEHRRRQCE